MSASIIWALQEDNAAYELGRKVGTIVPFFLALAVCVWALVLLSRPAAHRTCVLSLFVASASWLLISAGVALGQLVPGLAVLALVAAPIGFLGIIVAVILAIVGLAGYSNSAGRYKHGVGQAVGALVISGIMLLFGAIGAIQRAKESVEEKASAGPPRRFEPLNFTFTSPARSWVAMDAKKLNPIAAVAYQRRRPDMVFMIIAESVANPIEMSAFAEVVKANLVGASQSATILEEKPEQMNGMDGFAIRAEARVGNYDLSYRYWLHGSNGFYYQLIFWADRKNKSALENDAPRIFAGFKLIDPARQAGDGPPK